jgi:hypothetical protein
VTQLAIGVVYGLGAAAQKAGPEAERTQAIIIATLQVGLALYIVVLRPGVDRLDNALSCLQFVCEGASTVLLLLPTVVEDGAAMDFEAFCLALFAVGLPLTLWLYDSMVTPVVAVFASGGGVCELCIMIRDLLWSIPACDSPHARVETSPHCAWLLTTPSHMCVT